MQKFQFACDQLQYVELSAENIHPLVVSSKSLHNVLLRGKSHILTFKRLKSTSLCVTHTNNCTETCEPCSGRRSKENTRRDGSGPYGCFLLSAVFYLTAGRGRSRTNIVLYTVLGVRLLLYWWSRGESNPCPKVTWKELLRAQFVIYIPLLRRERTPYGVW